MIDDHPFAGYLFRIMSRQEYHTFQWVDIKNRKEGLGVFSDFFLNLVSHLYLSL